MTSKIHHNTTKKFHAIVVAAGVAATLTENQVTGNVELNYDDRVFECAIEDAKDMIEAFRCELEGDEEGLSLSEYEVEIDDDEEKEVGGTMVKPRYKEIYKLHNDTCGDKLAQVLQQACYAGDEWNEDNFINVCLDNGIDPKWRGNNGQRKMCLSNILRARLRKGLEVQVLSMTVTPDSE